MAFLFPVAEGGPLKVNWEPAGIQLEYELLVY